MNRTRIDWCDYTWNPVTGCLGPRGDGIRCSYCYARRLAMGRLKPLYLKGDTILKPDDPRACAVDPFAPRWWRDRLFEPLAVRKPSRIFVCDMGDLFGDWVPLGCQRDILHIARRCPQHTFMFLTKWPQNLARWNPWPPNTWVGATATNNEELWSASGHLAFVRASVRYLSIEPLLRPIDSILTTGLDWVIVGAMTGPGAISPRPGWVKALIAAADHFEKPLFLKDNLNWPEKRQEFPKVTA